MHETLELLRYTCYTLELTDNIHSECRYEITRLFIAVRVQVLRGVHYSHPNALSSFRFASHTFLYFFRILTVCSCTQFAAHRLSIIRASKFSLFTVASRGGARHGLQGLSPTKMWLIP